MTHAACLPIFCQRMQKTPLYIKKKMFPLFENTCAAQTEKLTNVHDKCMIQRPPGYGHGPSR